MTLKHRRKFWREFKLQVLAEIASGNSLVQASRQHQLHPNLINRWQNSFVNILNKLSLATDAPTLMRRALLNSNAWSDDSFVAASAGHCSITWKQNWLSKL
jgi:transposase-like protein